jgi:hypothetical protein
MDYTQCVARIYLRKCGKPTTSGMVADTVSKIKALTKKDPLLLEPQEVIQALKRGEEVIFRLQNQVHVELNGDIDY